MAPFPVLGRSAGKLTGAVGATPRFSVRGRSVGPIGLAVAVVLLAVMVVAIRVCASRGSAVEPSSLKKAAAFKKVLIVADDGTEHAASLSLEDVETIQDVLDAVADLMAEVLDVDIAPDQVEASIQDKGGRGTMITLETSFASILKSPVIRVRMSGSSKGKKGRDLD